MPNVRTLISLDWAMKKTLRKKANFNIPEGFFSELLKEDIKIKSFLENESKREYECNKYNLVDILAENENGEIIMVEIQFSNISDYFKRMFHGADKALVERMEKGTSYKNIVKIYSVNIVYFPLGDGSDYVYHGTKSFTGLHNGDVLKLTTKQKKFLLKKNVKDLFLEYYILDITKFNNIVKDPLDEWIYYLKNYKTETENSFKAKGLKSANKKLKYYALSESEQRAYDRMVHYERIKISEIETAFMDGKYEGREEIREKRRREKSERGLEERYKEEYKEGYEEEFKKGLEEGAKESVRQAALNMLKMGYSLDEISAVTNLTPAEIEELQIIS